MQLKMDKVSSRFDTIKVKKILLRENKFISNLLSITDLPEVKEDKDEKEVTNTKHNLKRQPPNAITSANGVPTQRAKSFEDLKNRLSNIQNKKHLEYKDKLLKKGLKTRMKKKTKKEERAQKKKLIKVEKAGGINGVKLDAIEDDDTKLTKPAKPVFNSEGKIVFSKFDFSQTGSKKDSKKTEKDPRKILANLKKQKDKLKHLEDTGEKDKADELKEKLAWKTALAKADGQKVKDDPELLKKSAKKQDQRKKASGKRWEERNTGVKNAQDERQKKRDDNINKRNKDRKNKKMKNASKRGRIIPGF